VLNLQSSADVLPFARDFFKFDDLPLIEVARPGPLDSRDVDEHVLAATLALKRSVAFLDLNHFTVPLGIAVFYCSASCSASD
jgi:hypothetical protein